MGSIYRYAIHVLLAWALLQCAALAGDGRIELSQLDFAAPPYVISSSGSFLLTEDITVTNSSVDGIQITAPDVTIDLNGFTLAAAAASGAGHGISGGTRLTVRNGKIAGWNDTASYGIHAPGEGNSFENITVAGCNSGILSGKSALITKCVSVGNESTDVATFGLSSTSDNCCSIA